jgi:hypothetical protein
MVRGVKYRELDQVVCWDNVAEPGISIANKWNSPALESLGDFKVELNMIEDIINDTTSIATEDCKEIAREIHKLFTTSSISNIPTIIHKW